MKNARITYQLPSGTAGDQLTPDTWAQHPLNKLTFNRIVGLTLEDNRITVPGGCYRIQATVAKPYDQQGRIGIYNVTEDRFFDDAQGVNVGPSDVMGGGPGAAVDVMILLTNTTTLELRAWFSGGPSPDTGLPLNTGDDEVYAQVVIEAGD